MAGAFACALVFYGVYLLKKSPESIEEISQHQDVNVRRRIEWDLSKTRSTDAINWPKDGDPKYYTIQEKCELTIKTEGLVGIDRENVKIIHCLATEGNIENIDCFIENMTKENAIEKAKKYMKEWNIALDKINFWMKNNKHDANFEISNNQDYPHATVGVCHSYEEELPWRVNLSISWLVLP